MAQKKPKFAKIRTDRTNFGSNVVANLAIHILNREVKVTVENGRSEPLQQGTVAFGHQREGFFEIPSREIPHVRDRTFDRVPRRKNGKIVLRAAHENKADVVVGFGGRKAPTAGTGFAGKKNVHPVRCFDCSELLVDIVGGDGLKRHCDVS